MINCNPETVSTDYDTSDRLYFEPLTAEDVLEIVTKEQSKGTLKGVIVQFGGQTPLKLAAALEDAGVPILGTSPDAIDLAEDRDRFKDADREARAAAADSGIARSPGEARAVADAIGYPVVIRPSYVLGGRAMEIVHDGSEVDRYVARLSATLDRPSELVVSDKRPLLIDRYLTDAVEVDVDCLADGKDTYVCGIMEHIEEAGIHSGDSACSLPPYYAQRRDARRARPADARACHRSQGRWPDERAVRHQGRRRLCARGEPARFPHRAVRRQGHRQADCRHCRRGDGRQAPRRLRPQGADV